MKIRTLIFLCFAVVFFASVSQAQITPWMPWTLLPENQVDELIGEVSGETTMNHVIEMAAYNHNRPASEYGTGTFWEAEYILTKMQEYGLPGATIVRFPGGQSWDGIRGELWEVSPNRQKLADYDDMTAMLASGSQNADVTTELVWVGQGSQKDFEGIDVNGKIVVTEAPASRVIRTADPLGAVGAISIYSSRPTLDPIQIPVSSMRPGENVKFVFNIPPRYGYQLKDRLLRGEQITVHALVESQTLSYEIQDPTCYVPGTDPNGDEIVFSAHLFEGYVKQGANDNVSGCAVILEVARALNTLFEEGRLPRPKRTFRFIWGPEFSGTRPWAAANPDIMERTLCNINLDMVGSQLSKNFSFYCVMRTTLGNPHYINDVVENYMRFVGQTNREILQNRGFAKFLKPILAPTGSLDPFCYSIETHYGASDHEVFNAIGVRVPGVLMITWPDQTYHTSSDRPTWMDATQLKRAAFIAAVSAYTIASADDDMAMKIAGEVTSNGTRRIGHQLARAMDELNRVEAPDFASLYEKVRGCIEAAAINEKATIESTLELATNTQIVSNYIAEMQQSIDGVKDGNLLAVDGHMAMTARRLGVSPVTLVATDLEIQAANLIPTPKEKLLQFSRRSVQELGEEAEKYPTRGVNTTEVNLLINGKNSALDIKKMLDVQYQSTTDLQGVVNYLQILKLLDMVEMN